MRIRILSDVHLERAPLALEAAGADVVVAAGDIGHGPAPRAQARSCTIWSGRRWSSEACASSAAPCGPTTAGSIPPSSVPRRRASTTSGISGSKGARCGPPTSWPSTGGRGRGSRSGWPSPSTGRPWSWRTTRPATWAGPAPTSRPGTRARAISSTWCAAIAPRCGCTATSTTTSTTGWPAPGSSATRAATRAATTPPAGIRRSRWP